MIVVVVGEMAAIVAEIAEGQGEEEEGGGGADDAADGRGDDETREAPPFRSTRRRDVVVRARHRHRVRQNRQRHHRRHGRTVHGPRRAVAADADADAVIFVAAAASSVQPDFERDPARPRDHRGAAEKRDELRGARDAVRDVVSHFREHDATGDDGVREGGESRDAERGVRVRANRVRRAFGGDGHLRRRHRRRVGRPRAHRAHHPPSLAKRRHQPTFILRGRLRQRRDAIERGVVGGRDRSRDVDARARKTREPTRLARRRRRRARRDHHANAKLARARHATRRVRARRVAERHETQERPTRRKGKGRGGGGGGGGVARGGVAVALRPVFALLPRRLVVRYVGVIRGDGEATHARGGALVEPRGQLVVRVVVHVAHGGDDVRRPLTHAKRGPSVGAASNATLRRGPRRIRRLMFDELVRFPKRREVHALQHHRVHRVFRGFVPSRRERGGGEHVPRRGARRDDANRAQLRAIGGERPDVVHAQHVHPREGMRGGEARDDRAVAREAAASHRGGGDARRARRRRRRRHHQRRDKRRRRDDVDVRESIPRETLPREDRRE